jgi:hypothetical protein
MENVKTIEDLRIVLLERIDQITAHSFKKLRQIPLESDNKKKVMDMYLYTQYIERKAFEMRLFIDEYVRVSNGVINSAVNDSATNPVNNSYAPDFDAPTHSVIRGSKMNDIAEDHPF